VNRGFALAVPVVAGALAMAGCGTARLPARPSPPLPVDLSVYVGARSVSVSPTLIGAGPVRLLIASEARRAIVLSLVRPGRSIAAHSTLIAPGGNQQLSVVLLPGVYRLVTFLPAVNQARLALPSTIVPARLLVGPSRRGSGDTLLAP
jgi:hypothetical protein